MSAHRKRRRVPNPPPVWVILVDWIYAWLESRRQAKARRQGFEVIMKEPPMIQTLESRRLLSAPPVLAEFTFDGPRFFGAAVDKLGNTTIAQSGADAVAGGQSGDASKKAAAWNRGVNDGPGVNAISLHLKPAKIARLALVFDYRSTAISRSGISFGPASIAIKVSIDHGKSFALLPIKLTRDSGWHQVSVDLSKVAGLSAAAGASIVLTAAKGADVGTLSIDDVRIVGVK
jgi:hypothetical protein